MYKSPLTTRSAQQSPPLHPSGASRVPPYILEGPAESPLTSLSAQKSLPLQPQVPTSAPTPISRCAQKSPFFFLLTEESLLTSMFEGGRTPGHRLGRGAGLNGGNPPVNAGGGALRSVCQGAGSQKQATKPKGGMGDLHWGLGETRLIEIWSLSLLVK